MSQKLTLARYLEGRGEVKSLTRIEAEAFGVPYPLVSGWPARFGAVEITTAMLEDLAARITTARQSTATKARRGLEGVEGRASQGSEQAEPIQAADHVSRCPSPARVLQGFVLRKARRYCLRGPAL